MNAAEHKAAIADVTPPQAAPAAGSAASQRTPRLLRAWRYGRLALHLAQGLLTVAFVYPLCSRPTHQALRRHWSAGLLRVLGIELEARGEPVTPGCMLVANHISWVDIFVINALAPSAFVSKAEVRTWPLIGWLAARNDTIFLRRGSRGHARIINAETAALLNAGCNVAIFPEGTTTDGSHLLHFHAALLQPAIACGHPLQPLALQYRTADDRFSRAPAYDGELSLGACVVNIVASRRTIARVSVAAPIPTCDGVDRRTLAAHAHAQIAAVIAEPGAASPQPGT